MNNPLDKDTFVEIIKEAVEIEKEFIIEALPCTLIGMNAKLMSQYIEYVSDRLAVQFGFDKIFNSENPFPFMNMLGLDSKTNFFEKRNTDYRMAGNQSLEEKEFNLDSDF